MAEALVGGAFLSASLQVLFDRLASPELINFFRGLNHDEIRLLIKKLKRKLLALSQVLNDAENKQFTNEAVKDWLDELKDAVYHAEDLVDEIATQALWCKVEAEYQSRTNQVQSWISTSTSLFDAEIESKLKVMIETLEDFAKDKDVLGLRDVVGHTWSQRLPSTSLVDESCLCGRDTEKEEIMEFLLSDGESSNKIGVIPIVGMGGVGKTTLAQFLYNDGKVDEHFGTKVWVCVSDVFDVLRITRTVVGEITGPNCNKNDLNSLQVELKKLLSGKKFLIVLDDVWNENYDLWDKLMTPFRFGAQGSRIIVTTRNNGVASIVRTVPVHDLLELPDEECWKLFAKHALENGDCSAYPDLESIGKEIARKCKGLPLAAKTLGGLLRSQRDVNYWNDILKSSMWELPEENSNFSPALRLSYYHLPSHLKRCFAYCSIFTKDYKFQREELVLAWIAEGFLEKPKSNKNVEGEGYKCFDELLSRSFFQKRSNAYSSWFVMHDLIHDLAQFVSGNFYYRVEDGKPHGISEKVRHFSYVQGTLDDFEKLKVIKGAEHVRTFLPLKCRGGRINWFNEKVFDKSSVDEILSRFRRLRFLSLSWYHIRELPHSIGNLIHLRFLDLSDTYIRQLPESICTMYNLETLLLTNCRGLTTLPANLGKLTLLRRLDLSGIRFLTEMPMHMSKLKNLQQLTAFVVGESSGSGINELKELCLLHGTISISGLQNVTSSRDALEAKMKDKMYLETLVLEWGRSPDDSQNVRDVLEKLQPHTNLKHLRIKNYRDTRFPAWLGDRSFRNMVSLYLVECKFCFSLPPLGQLPKLKDLGISNMPGITNVGHDFYGESGCLSKPFPSLETLSFSTMSEWVDWCILDAGEFPRLQKLDISDCPKLIENLPKKVPSLVSLKIRECPELVASLPRSTFLRELQLRDCQGVQLEWQGLSSVETVEISNFASLKEFPSELVTLTSLKELKITSCPSLLSSPDMELLPMLKSLHIRDCEAMHCFPGEPCVERSLELVFPLSEEMSHCYASLVSLDLSMCQSLKSLPLGLFPKLGKLIIQDCSNFENMSIPNGIELQDLSSLSIFLCDNMVSFPRRGLPAPNLSHMTITECDKLKALPKQMHTLLPSLISLHLHDCPEVESFPEGGLPLKLRDLRISNCKKLVGGRRDWGLQTLPSLTHFQLGGDPQDGVMESFPEEGLLPSTLTSLCMENLPNLKSLNNKALQLLCSLKYMEIWNCPQLQSLPEEGLTTSLFRLQVQSCPLLGPRCCGEEGEDWHKIAHVPSICVDGFTIQDQVSLDPIPSYSYGI